MIYILIAALFFMILTSVVLMRNRFEFKSIDEVKLDADFKPMVSVCIPARNEEAVIERCVTSILNQHYENFEVLVLDDNSEDSTLDILENLSSRFKQLTILNGTSKPKDWLGKPWACNQLSNAANGEILVFIDSDVWIETDTLSKAVAKIKSYDAITVWPQQKVVGFLEKLIVPTVYFSLITLLPAIYVERSPRWMPPFLRSFMNQKFVAACGQFIAFKKSAYQAINGHEGVKTEVVEDMELARNLKQNALSLSMSTGINSVYCRMYTTSSDVWQGFQKNFLQGFGNIFEFIFMGIIHFLFFLYPIYSLVIGLTDEDLLITLLSLGIILVFIGQRFVLNIWFNWNWWMALLHPFAVLWFQVLGLKSVINKLFGLKSTWKGRQV